MKLKFRIKHLFYAAAISALLVVVWKAEFTEFVPAVCVDLKTSRDANSIYVELRTSSIRPLWIQGADQYITNYHYRVSGSTEVVDGRIYGTAISPSDWIRVSNVQPTELELPRDTKTVQIEVTVYDWRGRYKQVWSPVLEL